MMVLASVYLSVSSSLASTPNIKPVEIWLLVNLAFPFLVILVNVIIQVTLIFSTTGFHYEVIIAPPFINSLDYSKGFIFIN